MDNIRGTWIILFCLVGQGFIFANAKEKSKISMDQKLSPYELAMVSDLLVQISMYRCPAVSRPAMKSMKRFIFSTFAKAPEIGAAHPLFYSNYRSLVECLNYVDEYYPKKSLATLYQQKGFDLQTRRKRETTGISKSEEINVLYPGEEVPKSTDLKTPFEQLFNDLYGIVKYSCPSDLAPNANFVTNSMTEIVEWTTTHNMAIQAQEKYFDRLGLLKQIHKCSNLVASTSKQLSKPF